MNFRHAKNCDDAFEMFEPFCVVQCDAGQIDVNTFLAALEFQRRSALELCADNFRVNRWER